jgi:hypothetical protein
MSTTATHAHHLDTDVSERQILQRVDRAVKVGEAQLRYQLDRKDHHPLARPTSCSMSSGTWRLSG